MILHAIAAMLLIVVSAGVAGCTMWKEPKHVSWKNATGLEDHERLFWDALKAKDWLSVEQHMASNYKLVTPEKVYTKDEAVAIYKDTTLLDFTLADFDVTQSGETWVVSYTATYTFDYQGKRTGPQSAKTVSVWQKQKSGWVKISEVDLGKPQ